MLNNEQIIKNVINKTNKGNILWEKRSVPDGYVFESKYKISENLNINLQALLCKNINKSYLNFQILNKNYDKIIYVDEHSLIYSLMLILNYQY